VSVEVRPGAVLVEAVDLAIPVLEAGLIVRRPEAILGPLPVSFAEFTTDHAFPPKVSKLAAGF
jgi:hypothetical protein